MHITRLEKTAFITAGAGASFMALLWNLAVPITATDQWVLVLRAVFAIVSFTAFDLVLLAVVLRGMSPSGIAALIVTSGVSGAIGLEVAGVVSWPALHAAPALTLAAFGAHLMISRPTAAPAPGGAITNNTQINVGVLPRTFADFAAARAAELPNATPAQLAAELGTGEATIRKLLDLAGVTINQVQED